MLCSDHRERLEFLTYYESFAPHTLTPADRAELVRLRGAEPCCSVSTPEIPATPEPFPIEVWTFFSDSDLDQLVVDARAEMGRRELERGRKS